MYRVQQHIRISICRRCIWLWLSLLHFMQHKKLCKQNFSEKGSFHFTHTPHRCAASVASYSGRPIPISTSVIYGCYGRLSLPFYYVFVVLVQRYWRENQQCKNRMMKIKEKRREKKTHAAIPCHVVCYIHFVWSFGVNVLVRLRTDQLCTYYLWMDVCRCSI